MDRRRALLLLACCAALARAGAALAQTAPPRGEGAVRIAYKNAPMANVVNDLARATGVTLIYDEKIRELGSVTIEGPPQVSREEALAMLDSLLLLRGFAAVPGPGGARKITPISGAPSPWNPGRNLPATDAPVTTLVRLENANAADLVPLLAPYLGANSAASAFGPTNSLILSGPASLLSTLRIAIDALDRAQSGAPLIWPMRVATASTVAQQLREIAEEIDVPYVSSDDRLNAVLLRIRPGETERIRDLVDRLDRPAHGAASIEVLKLRYADPEELAQQLLALRNDTGSKATGAAQRAGLRGLAFEVAADVPTHSIVVSGAPETVDAVLDVVSELDRVPASVRVEITIASVDLDDQLTLGVDWLIPSLANTKDPNDLVAAVFANPSGGGFSAIDPRPTAALPFVASFTRDPLLLPIINPITGEQFAIPEGATITMNGRTVKSDVLLRPNLLITSGHEHEIFAGDNVPVPVAASGGGTGTTTGLPTGVGTTGTGTRTGTTGGTSGGTGSTSGLGNAALDSGSGTGGTTPVPTGTSGTGLTIRQNIERKDVGTTLRVTPTVGEQGGVTLELRVEVSSIAESVSGPVEEVGVTIKDTTIESTIRLDPGEIAVIATAAQPEVQRTKTGIPWLMDIPVLGWAFRTTHEQTLNHHLLVAARAEIFRPESHDLAERLAREVQLSQASTTKP